MKPDRWLPRRLSDFRVLTAAEQAVVKGLETGHVIVLGPDLPDRHAGEDRRVRASLVRWLALGAPGDPAIRLHAHGLQIKGALIIGDGAADPDPGMVSTPGLDLGGCTLPHDLLLAFCRFAHAPFLMSARVQTLNLLGSHLPGLTADGLKVWGDVFLRQVQATGELRLLGVQISGNLSCEGGRFENVNGKALNAQGARVTGAFLWRPDEDGRNASVTGELDLTAAEIGHINDDPACWPAREGDLVLDRCRYGAFTGRGVSAAERIRWLKLQDPSKFGKDFWPQPWEQCAQVLREMGHPEDARAVLIEKERLQRADLRRRVALRLEAARWRVRLASAEPEGRPELIGAMNDRLKALRKNNRRDATLLFEELKRSRHLRALVRKGEVSGDHPGLWHFLTVADGKVAAASGARGDPVLAARAPVPALWLAHHGGRLWDGFLGLTIDYGQRPLKAAGWLVCFWALGAFLFWGAYQADRMKPNNPFILRSAEWVRCDAAPGETVTLSAPGKTADSLRAPGQTRLACFAATPEGAGFPAFNAGIYAFDVLFPLVELEQQAHWVPDATGGPGDPGWWAKGLVYLEILAGWGLSLLAVAGFSGLVKSD